MPARRNGAVSQFPSPRSRSEWWGGVAANNVSGGVGERPKSAPHQSAPTPTPPHHALCAWAAGEIKQSRSRDAVFFAPESSASKKLKTTALSIFVRAPRLWNGPESSRSGAARKPRKAVGSAKARSAVPTHLFFQSRGLRCRSAHLQIFYTRFRQIKGSRTPTDVNQHPQLPLRHALFGARPPVGVPLRLSPRGQLVAQGSASGHASGDSAGALDPVRPPQPGGGDLTLLHGRYPRPTCPSPASTSRAGRYAGRMMPDAARVQR